MIKNQKVILIASLISLFAAWVLVKPSTARAASLSLSPATSTQNVGDTFAVDILLDTEGTAASGATAILNYDTAKLQVQDDDAGTAGVQIKAGPTLTQTLTNTVDATAGQVRYDAGNLGSNFTGRGVIATIHFKALAGGTAQVNYVFDPNSTNNTSAVAAASGPTNLLTTVNNGNYTIGTGTSTTTTPLPSTGTAENSLMVLVGGLTLLTSGFYLTRKLLFSSQ